MENRRSQRTFAAFDLPDDDGGGRSPNGGSPAKAGLRPVPEGKADDESCSPDDDGGASLSTDCDAGDSSCDANHAPSKGESLAGKTVYVIDAHSLIYQVFHALPEMSGPAGQPVGAIHGFIRDIAFLLESKKPDYLFCAFDKGDTFRHELYEAYKANRASMPDDLRPQIPNIVRMLEALGVPALTAEGFEADDLLATIGRLADEAGAECYLVTGDKDCRQLITDRVRVYNIRKDQSMDADQLLQEWGVRPEQVVDFQALTGDSTDNVPGVPGIGPKTATALLAEFGSLDDVLRRAAEIKAKARRENLIKHREQALLSRQLARLDSHVPIEIDWSAARVGGVDREEVERLCQEFGFRSLADRLAGFSASDAPARWQANYVTVESTEQLREFVDAMRQAKAICVDTETTSTNPRMAELVGVSFSWREGEAYYVPVRSPAGDVRLRQRDVIETLRPVLEDESLLKIGQNLKYDMIVLRGAGEETKEDVRESTGSPLVGSHSSSDETYSLNGAGRDAHRPRERGVGIDLAGPMFDTMVADYLLESGERNHSVDDLAKRYLNHKTIKIAELIGTGKKQKRMDEVPVPLITDYAAEDADVPLRLHPILDRRLRDEGLDELFRELEMPLVEVLAEMEWNGIKIDVPRLETMSVRFAGELERLQREIVDLAGESFNIDSRQQLAAVLFDKLGLPVVKKTKTGGPSTDVEVLEELAPRHPLPAKIIEYRQVAKLKSTYVDALPQLVHPRTGRVHTSFKQDVAATGRLSSTDPNLQNIPVRTEAGREIRSAFVPGEPGWRLMKADYSQIELRILAHFSNDDAMQQAFRNNEDIHAAVAAEINRVPLDQVTREMRRQAKAVNFGVIYGQSPFGLSKALGIETEEAAEFIDAYFARYHGVADFITKTLEDCRKKGYVSTALGRRRAVDGVRDPSQIGDSRQRNLPERIAINTVIQGSAADLIKQAMIQVRRELRRQALRARMLLQIHDELVFEVPPDELSDLVALVTREMTGVGRLDVPLIVDVAAGENWAECEPIG